MNNQAIINMENHLRLPQKSGYSFNILFQLAKRFETVTGSDRKITPLSLLYYLDSYGDFTTKKDKYSIIVNKIFQHLNPNDIMQVVPFIELCQNNYKEEQ